MVEPDDRELSIPRGGFLETTVGGSARRGIVADNDDTLRLPAGEPLAVAAAALSARRQIMADRGSLPRHASSTSASALFFADARAGRRAHGRQRECRHHDRSATRRTIRPCRRQPPGNGHRSDTDLDASRQARRATDAVAVTQVERAEIVEPLLPEATAVETLEPVERAAVAAATPLEPAVPVAGEAAATAETLPEILASETLHSNATDTVAPVTPKQATAESVERAKAAEVEATDSVVAAYDPEPKAKPAAKPKPAAKQPAVEKPAGKATKKTRAAEPTEKPRTARAKADAGSAGHSATDVTRGTADGSANGNTLAKGKSGKSTAAGNAAVSNYPGKVMAKLRRAARGISRGARMKAQRDVHIAFVVNASGGAGGIRIVQSSGSAALDQAALDTVARAAPFPPIPPEAKRSSWRFTLPLGVAR